MTTAGFTVISRLRSDGNVQYLSDGAQKRRGRPRKYDGKVDFNDVSRFEETTVKAVNKEVKVYAKVVWSVSLKRTIKLVVVKYEKKTVNLFSTDLDMVKHIDCREKLLFYQQMLSVQEYAIVDQYKIIIELHRRQSDGNWITYYFDKSDEEIEFQSVGLTLPISEIYRRVRFNSENASRNN